MMKIAFLSSGEGIRFQSLIEAKKGGQLKAEISCLITDKADCGAAQKARDNTIRVYFFDAREVDPIVYDEGVEATVEFFKADIVAMDGYGRPMTPALAEKFEGRLVTLDSEESVQKLIQRVAEGEKTDPGK